MKKAIFLFILTIALSPPLLQSVQAAMSHTKAESSVQKSKVPSATDYTVTIISTGNYTITSDGYYRFENGYSGTITIATTASTVVLTGSSDGLVCSETNIAVANGRTTALSLTIDKLKTYKGPGGGYESVSGIKFSNDAALDNHLYISGNCSVTGSGNGAGIEVSEGAKLTIDKVTSDANDVLTVGVTGGNGSAGDTGAGIGSFAHSNGGTIVINGGTINASSYAGGGIGAGGHNGSVTINGGIINSSSCIGAGIGGGNGGKGGTIIITGGTVTAINYAAYHSAGAAGIGGGGGNYATGPGGVVTISGGTVTATGISGAGIGGGPNSSGGVINISGGTVTANGTGGSAGIGGGYGGGGATVTITGKPTIIATGDVASGAEHIGHGLGSTNSGTLTDGTNSLTYLRFKAANGSGTAVAGAQVSFDGHSYNTNSLGLTGGVILQSKATANYTVNASGYTTLRGTTSNFLSPAVTNLDITATIQPPGITKMEYWIDGNASARTVKAFALVPTYNWTDLLDYSGLGNGLHVLHSRYFDSNGVWSSVSSAFFLKTQSDIIVNPAIAKMEYWIDSNSSTRAKKATTPTLAYQWLDSLDMSGLNDGLHVGHVRFCDNTGKWSGITSSFFLKMKLDVIANPAVTKMEYWIDGGSATRTLKTVTSALAYQWLDSLDMSGLNDGLHVGHVRFCDRTGKWSGVNSSFFLKLKSDVIANSAVAKMEYWLDGNSSSRIVKTISPVKNYQWLDSLDMVGLSDGLHVGHVRFCDRTGKWSSVTSSFFQKSNLGIITNPKISKMEYWLDNNRKGIAKKVPVSPANPYQWLDSIGVNALVAGMHTLNVRFCDTQGKWSSLLSNFIEQREMVGNNNRITSYRYWFDIEPNYRPNVAITASQPTAIIQDSLNVAQLPKGDRIIYFQYRDAQGKWSSVMTDTITKSNNPLFHYTADNQQLCDSGTVNFNSDTLFVKRLEWKFGDLATGIGIKPAHKYVGTGDYDVMATVWYKGTKDSVVYAEPAFIRVHPSSHTQASNNIVYGDSISFGGVWHKLPGKFTLNLQTKFGCDSICILNLALTKAQLTVMVNDTTRNVNTANSVFRLSYSGFVFNEGPSVLDVPPVATTLATVSSPEGVYDVLVSGGDDDHYSFMYQGGKLKVIIPAGLQNTQAVKIILYPNPVKTLLTIHSDMAVMQQIELMDGKGSIVLRKECKATSTEQVDMANLGQGLYIVRILTDKGMISGKIIKE